MSCPKVKKKSSFCNVVFSSHNSGPFLRLWHVILYNGQWPARWLNREETPNTSQNQTCTPKMPQPLFGGLLRVWSTTACWVLVKPLHLRTVLSKSTRCTENCRGCSRHRSKEGAWFFSTTVPNRTVHDQCFKSWTKCSTKLCLICRIHLTSRQLTTTSSSISTTFLRENTCTTSRRRKRLSKSSSHPRARTLHGRSKQTYFSLAKMPWLHWFLFCLIKTWLSLVVMM